MQCTESEQSYGVTFPILGELMRALVPELFLLRTSYVGNGHTRRFYEYVAFQKFISLTADESAVGYPRHAFF